MRIEKLFGVLVLACVLGAFASGSASADGAETIIAEFCQDANRLADDAEDELFNANDDLRECRRDFSDCRDGGLGNDDPLVQCLSRGLSCTSRGLEDRGEACDEFARELRDSYSDALENARRNDVEEEVQEFFYTESLARSVCLATTLDVAVRCKLPSSLLP